LTNGRWEDSLATSEKDFPILEKETLLPFGTVRIKQLELSQLFWGHRRGSCCGHSWEWQGK
jgi:hypothetical protein